MPSEVRMDHGTIVATGRNSGDLMMNLGGNIERLRRLYEARVPVRTLADGDRIVLGGAR
jgi:hypothetical protein